jgi:GAF domain-containing protein
MCLPILDVNGVVQGVIELVNKARGIFTDDDERAIQLFNVFVGIALQNARKCLAAVHFAVEIAEGPQAKITALLKHIRTVIEAGRVVLFVLNSSGRNYDVFAIDEDVDARTDRIERVNRSAAHGLNNAKKALVHRMMNAISRDDVDGEQQAKEDRDRSELVTAVVKERRSMIANPDVEEDSMLASPVIRKERVVAVLLLQWKKKEPRFLDLDIPLAESFARTMASFVARHSLKASVNRGLIESDVHKAMTQSERQAVVTPANLKLDRGDRTLVLSTNFQIQEFAETDPSFLKIGISLFDCLHIRKGFGIRNENLFFFIAMLRTRHVNVLFHDWPHAINVARFLVYLIVHAELLQSFNAVELLAMVLAGLRRGGRKTTPEEESDFKETRCSEPSADLPL